MSLFFFFSSRRRHTRCALVTGVQTCALPISADAFVIGVSPLQSDAFVAAVAHHRRLGRPTAVVAVELADLLPPAPEIGRASCRERVSTCRSRWSPFP